MIAPEYTDLWPLIQRDVLGCLQADPFFAARPGVLVEPGDIQSVIDSKLAKCLGKGTDGLAGVGYLVLPIERAEDEDLSVPFGPLKLTLSVQFCENVTVNRGAIGTKIPIRVYAARAAKIFKIYTPVGLTQSFVPQNPVINEFLADETQALRIGQVEFTAREADDIPLIRTTRPRFSIAGTTYPYTVTITSDGAEVIYYTTDGSHPFADNFTATKYVDPVTVADPCFFRARAFAAGQIGSDTQAHRFA